jgi:uncharacterized membrane protein
VEPRRTESFSDGVFAVAITVLVFNLLPIAKAGITPDDLATAWPQYAGYVISFLTIGIMWLNHHTLLSQAVRVDRTCLVLNLFLLMGVVTVPFTTALVADTIKASNSSSARLAAVVYGLLMVVISIGFQAIWLYLSSHREALSAPEERPDGSPRPPQPTGSPLLVALRFGAGLGGYIVAVVVAALGSALAALVIYGVVAVYYLFEHLPGPTD